MNTGRGRSRSRRAHTVGSVLAIVAAATAFAAPGIATPSTGATGPTPFIVNGSGTTIGQWPYLVGLLHSNVADPYAAQFCGGSVAADDLVITAAHCVEDEIAADLDILYGATTLQVGEGTRVPVASISIHPAWDTDTSANDLAVLRLSAAIPAPPILVAPPGYEGVWAPGNTVQSAGWGCTSVSGLGACQPGGFPTDLRAGSMPMRSDDECTAALGDLFDASSMRCAGRSSNDGSATDTCQGDSGGPLRIARAGLPPMLVGVVSWGINCGRLPGVYTRLEAYRSWLRSEGVPIPTIAFRGAPTRSVTTVHAHIVGCDFNADDIGDIVLYQPGGGDDEFRLGTASGSFRDGPPISVGSNFVPLAGDFDGDGACDLLWYRPGDASEALWRGSAFGFIPASAPNVVRSYAPAVGDFDGDGFDDILWYAPGGPRSLVWYGSSHGFVAGPNLAAPAGAVAVAGDFSGNGRADVYFDAPEPGPDVTWAGNPAGFTNVTNPNVVPGDGPLIAGDYDGDGFDDLFRDRDGDPDELWRGRNGARFERRSHPFQPADHVGVGGRFDGDGRADIWWYRAGNGAEVLWRGLP